MSEIVFWYLHNIQGATKKYDDEKLQFLINVLFLYFFRIQIPN